MIKPITPDQVASKKLEIIPSEVIEVFNKRIASSWSGHRSIVKVVDIVDDILLAMPNLTRDDIYNKNYLEIEDIFREAGWKVEYDQPDYSQDYDSFFTFKRK
jgi:hypothetical protein